MEAQLKSAEEIAVARDKECEQMKSEMERLGDVAKKNASLTQSNNALRNRNKMLTEDNASISKNFEEAQASIKELSDKYAELEKSQDRVTKDLLNLQNKYNASQNYVASLEYDLAQSRKSEEAAKTALSNEVKRNSGASSNEFEELMRKREVQIRKAREDAMKGQNTENNN